MAKPFTSRDGADSAGVRAEVHVQVGEGTITSIDNLDNDKPNVRVVVKSSNARVTRPINGWLERTDPILDTVIEAHQSGREISYRVEAQRKKSVDRKTPIADLRTNTEVAAENTISIFAGIDGVLSAEAVTNPAEDPAEAGGRVKATGPAPAPVSGPQDSPSPAPAATVGPEQALAALGSARNSTLPQSVVDATAALALVAGATPEQVAGAGFDPQRSPARGDARRGFAAEAAPFKPYNTDDRVNLGSYAVQAAFAAEQVAYTVIEANHVDVFEEHNRLVEAKKAEGDLMTEPAPVDMSQAAGLAQVFLNLADRIQVGAYTGGRPDRMANSHTRARALVFDTVKHRHKVPFGVDAEEREAWLDLVVSECVERFQRLAQIAVDVPNVPAPAQPQAATPDAVPTSGQTAETGPSAEVDAADAAGAQTTEQIPAQVAASPAETTPAPADEQAAPQASPAETASAEAASAEAASAEAAPAVRTEQARGSRARVEGDEGFQAPDEAILGRFAALAQAAGFPAGSPHSPVVGYLTTKFNVNLARKVHGEDLDRLVTWYEGQGERSAGAFREHVLSAQPAPQGEQQPA